MFVIVTRFCFFLLSRHRSAIFTIVFLCPSLSFRVLALLSQEFVYDLMLGFVLIQVFQEKTVFKLLLYLSPFHLFFLKELQYEVSTATLLLYDS